MPSWNELLDLFGKAPDQKKSEWLRTEQVKALARISALREGRHVIFYTSAFLEKPLIPAYVIQITHEDINAFMSVMYGMTWTRGLTLILHTPGGVTNATETIVAYLRSKFAFIEVIIPTYAMSAGTMISLAADRIVMGRQSQMGPIDPQFLLGGGALSARAIVDQFAKAKEDILSDVTLAHLWAPILQTIGPALLQEAQNALDYGEGMVAKWLEAYMFKNHSKAKELATRAAAHFNDAAQHKSHGRRIDREEARSVNLNIEDLENSQDLQDNVLTAYHLATIGFEKGPATKSFLSDTNRMYVKNFAPRR